MTWSWEYHPDEQHVAAGAPPALLAEVASRADELVRAAEARYLDGTTHQGPGEGLRTIAVADGFFAYFVVPRQQRVYVCQLTSL
ncbi:hypothetical protein ACIQBJ_28855 [Kitasatospora sp. NPDC088391]|uniref:hypothetical protein n=1 Tax=Kitasatospora sp. NPDC088391 TaxID=3364074 RepID=UPI003827A795